ncbi:MAG: cellulase family glycosylhydrolase [Candidatus Coatesbacteria bacterium]
MPVSALLLAVAVHAATGGDIPNGWFPFALADGDGALGAADVSFLNETPAGKDGFVSARDGHFVDGKGRRIRFFATNLTGTACFPEPAEAPKLAKRLRALGFNLVRLHFMDIETPAGLLRKDLVTFDPGQLTRLDDLVAALKAEGIYVDLNLHVARRYPGIVDAAAERFGFGKVLDRFYPPFVEMQEKYARDLLTHVNAKTGVAYAREPAVALVELNNENTLLPFWGGSPTDLPEPFAGELVRQWRAWLAAKYRTTAALRAAWGPGAKPAGPEMLRNGDLRKGTADWIIESAGGAQAALQAVAGGGLAALRWTATKAGTADWNLQLMQTGLEIRPGIAYEVSFRARSNSPMVLWISVMLQVEPWTGLGLDARPALSTEWKTYAYRFTGASSGGPRARLNLSTGNRTGTVELAALSLREAGLAGLAEDESLEAGTVALRSTGTSAVTLDYWTFLVETERGVTKTLMDYLRHDLGVVAPICDTQAGYGQAAGVLREAAYSDFIDEHAYWEHPEFPGKGWDPVNWRIPNTDQVAVGWGGVLEDLALRRVEGKPFTVSEYNLPTPNDHAASALPMLAALAAFQDWDAIYAYTYLDFRREWAADHFLGFFDFAGHPGKLVFAPAAAVAFRLGLVAPGRDPVTITLPRDAAPGLLARNAAGLRDVWESAGVEVGMDSVRRMRVRIVEPGTPIASTGAVPVGSTRTSDTGEITWRPGKEAHTFTVEAPGFRMAAGTLGGTTVRLGDAMLEIGKVKNSSACVAIVALDGKPLADSSRVLVSIAARVENQGMKWNADRTSIGRDWGHGPTIAERVPATLTLPGSGWKAEVLDGAGHPAAKLAVRASGNGTSVALNAKPPYSLWFLLTR